MALPDINIVGAILVAVGEGEWVLGAGGGTQQEDSLLSYHKRRVNMYSIHESFSHPHVHAHIHRNKKKPSLCLLFSLQSISCPRQLSVLNISPALMFLNLTSLNFLHSGFMFSVTLKTYTLANIEDNYLDYDSSFKIVYSHCTSQSPLWQ